MFKARVIIGLAVVFDATFWLLVIWAPIGWLLGVMLAARQISLTLVVAGLLACGLAALLAKGLAHAVWTGHRAAFVLVCALLLGIAGYHVWRATVTTSATAILAASRAAVYIGLAAVVASAAVRPPGAAAIDVNVKPAAKGWIVAIALSLVMTAAAYYSYGLTRANIVLHTSTVVVEYLTLLAWAYAVHRILRIHRIESDFATTFRLYTVVTAPLAPFATLVALPGVQRAAHVLPGIRTFRQFVNEAWLATQVLDDGVVTKFIALLHPIIVLAVLIAMATFVVLISEHDGVETRRAGRAVAFAMAVILPLILAPLIVLQYRLITYA